MSLRGTKQPPDITGVCLTLRTPAGHFGAHREAYPAEGVKGNASPTICLFK